MIKEVKETRYICNVCGITYTTETEAKQNLHEFFVDWSEERFETIIPRTQRANVHLCLDCIDSIHQYDHDRQKQKRHINKKKEMKAK